jgi:putative alpha-1,2-mannosidase
MGLTILDAYNVVVKDFAVIQPSFWAHLAAQSENVYYHNMYVNATNENPEIVSTSQLVKGGFLMVRLGVTPRSGFSTRTEPIPGVLTMSPTVRAIFQTC